MGQPRVEIIGFSISGPPPLGEVHIAWSDGLTVLYGANGSGKTSILEGIYSAMTGLKTQQREENSAWIRAAVTLRLIDWDEPLPPPVELRSGGASWTGGHTSGLDDALSASILDCFLAVISRPATMFDERRLREYGEGLLAQLQNHSLEIQGPSPNALIKPWVGPTVDPVRHLVLTATGEGEPSWGIHLGIDRFAGASAGSKVLDRSAKYAYVYSQVMRTVTATDAERTDREWAIVVDRAIEQCQDGGVDLSDLDRDLIALVFSSERSPDTDLFFTDLQGFAGIEVSAPLFEEILVSPTWVPFTRDGILLSGNLDGLPVPIRVTDGYQRVIDVLVGAGEATVSPDDFIAEVQPFMEMWEAKANSVADTIVPRVPRLQWRPASASEWLTGSPIVWDAIDPLTDMIVPLERLSASERRWCNLVLVLTGIPYEHAILLLDEPELGLHRKAVGEVARRLLDFADAESIPIIAASHSSEFLSLPSASLNHVARTLPFGLSSVSPVSRGDLQRRAESLGLTVGDLLQLVRTFVVVEGEHDRVAIEAIIGDELREGGAEVVAMQGAKKLVTLADAEVIFRYTDASILIVLDAMQDVDGIRQMWAKVTAKVRAGQQSEAVGAITTWRQDHRSPGYEETQLLQFAEQVIGHGDPSRVSLFGFAAPDVIEYFDPNDFGLSESWAELRRQFNADRISKFDFKTWLRVNKNADITVNSVAAAASRFSPGADGSEFTRLLNAALL